MGDIARDFVDDPESAQSVVKFEGEGFRDGNAE
jgi:hypothetical protein